MKKIDIAQTIQVLANLGIIIGLAFLVIEVRQNNEHLAAQSRFNRVTNAIGAYRAIAQDPDLIATRVRSERGETLTEEERRRVEAFFMANLIAWEWTYREIPGDAPEMIQVRDVFRRTHASDPAFRRLWEERKAGFDPGFVAWADENVLPPPSEP